MSLHVFLLCLLMASAITGLVTEGIKNLLDEWGVKYYANTLAAIVSLVVGGGLGTIYVIYTGMAVTPQVAVYLIALAFLSWLCAMVGYDKVMQAFGQFRDFDSSGGEDNKQ